MEIGPRQVLNYITPEGRDTFREWLTALKDSTARATIRARIDRLLLGNLGDNRRLNGDLYELRIHYGPGYRIYCGDLDGETVILLWGGTKRTQKRDIQKAKTYWQELRSRPL
ncbi:type II toxin-antitoxin system RelE/ParE family toxin [Candidatus Poribacteria bacterium]|nr:type II toxin-antitoxin system RelE/ParE family toxin [Candidatus Poribacteria bacterium]